jgi:hypothetical protein
MIYQSLHRGRPAAFFAVGAIIFFAAHWLTPSFAQTSPREGTSTAPFSDLGGHAAEIQSIDSMVAQGILSGVSPTEFAPEAPLTHGDFVIAMLHMFKLPRTAHPTEFSDIPLESPLHGALEAVEPFLGRQLLCFGCALGKNFMPRQAISSAETAFTLVRILTAQNKLQLLSPVEIDSVLAKVSDASQLSRPSRVYFATAIRNGILSLGPDNKMDLTREQTRAGAAVLLDRVQQTFDVPRVNPSP